jgi:hypothetical protein
MVVRLTKPIPIRMQTVRNHVVGTCCLALIQALLGGRPFSPSFGRGFFAANSTSNPHPHSDTRSNLRREAAVTATATAPTKSTSDLQVPSEKLMKCNDRHGSPCGPDLICVDRDDSGYQCLSLAQQGVRACPVNCGPNESCLQSGETFACGCHDGYHRPTPYLACVLDRSNGNAATDRDLEPVASVFTP